MDHEVGLFDSKIPLFLEKLRDEWPNPAPNVTVRHAGLKWRITSAMQKEFRRCHDETMEKFLTGLHLIDSNYAWRRFTVVVIEDAGPQAIRKFRDEMILLLWLARGKKYRDEVGATVDDLARLARRMAKEDRDRVCCDQNVIALYDEQYAKAREGMAIGMGPITAKACAHEHGEGVALVLASELKVGAVDCTAKILDGSESWNYDPVDRWIALEGVRQKQGGMYGCYPWVLANDDSTEWRDDEMPPHEMIGCYPTYALDMHTSDGKRAIYYFLAMKDVPVVKYLRDRFSDDRQKMFEALSEPLFWAEVGRLARRRRCPIEMGSCLGERLQTRVLNAFAKKNGIPATDHEDVLKMLWDAIPQLNYARKRVVSP